MTKPKQPRTIRAMEINEDQRNSDYYYINSYSDSSVSINQKHYDSSLLLTPTHLSSWPINNITALAGYDFSELITLQPELVLLGRGNNTQRISDEVLAPLFNSNISVEQMNNGAACRTFNALAQEGRNVLLALIIE